MVKKWFISFVQSAAFISLSTYALVMLLGVGFWLTDHTDKSSYEFLKTLIVFALWGAPVAALVAVLMRRWPLVALLMPLVAAFTIYYLPWYLPRAPQAPPDAPRLTVATFNILRDGQGMDEMLAVIRKMDADIIALQEFGKVSEAYFTEMLQDLYPHHATFPQEGRYTYFYGQGVYSKYPIVEREYWREEDLPISHGNMRVVLDINGADVVLYNVHPWPSIQWNRQLANFGIVYDANKDISHSVAFDRLIKRIKAEGDVPLILVGDLNMSEQYTEYADVSALLTDVHRAAGWGMGYTYPDIYLFRPVLRLDYVFVSDHFAPLALTTYHDSTVSDHLPVKAEIALIQ